ncbi:MAG: helix-turn-helix transcriptional regulator [Lentisphaeria bacterium]|nr:helix-turn-helix transcriptional regulator [Lentisphaeria bacterium]
MKVCYKKLWKLLIDREMTRTELRLKAGISSVALAKLGKDEGVTTNILVKVCAALDCNIGDIMDVVPEGKNNAKK